MTVYTCIDCGNDYCVDCEGGVDACEFCGRGPLCDDCAYDHETDHKAEAESAVDEERDDREDTQVFGENADGEEARERWARYYDELNGAPENEEDR